MRSAMRSTLRSAFRRAALPLASYYAITLAVPLVNGAAVSGRAFAMHAVTVAIVPLCAIVLACAVHASVRLVLVCWRSRARAEGHPRVTAASG